MNRSITKLKNIFSTRNLLGFLKKLAIAVVGFFLLFLLLSGLFPLSDKIEFSTIITDNKGNIINAYLSKDEKWRMKTELNEVSPLLRKAIVAKEDYYFYHHPGINPFAIARALFKNIFRLKRTSGASTITMQVAKALEHRPRNILSKTIEAFRALQLEWKYSKAEILTMYLNLVPYGGNIEGVKSAAILYFGKNPDHLSLAEIMALSIVPNRPSSLVIGKHNDRIIIERNKWLKKFAEENVFTQKEIQDALAEPLTAFRTTVPHYIPHLAYKLKKSGSDIIKTNIDLNTQLKIEKIVADYVRGQRLRNIKNAAVVVINNKTHKVVSYLGSSDFNDATDAGQVNGAAAIRQPGSTLKPLLYAMCFDEGILTPKSMMTDVPINYEGYAPENYDERFNGYVTTEFALEHSLNIPAVKSLRKLGYEKFIQKLISCHFKQIEKDKRKLGLSMILGGCGSSLEELTGLFSCFANEGIYISPSFTQADTDKTPNPIVSSAATFMINETLSKINRPDFPINWAVTEHMPKIAWKTGTSYGRRDGWSIGYNKNFTIGVWVGNFSGVAVADLSGANVATPLLFKIFNTLDYDSDEEWFSQPDDCDIRQVCSETGMPPADDCKNIVTDYFIPLVSNTSTCNNEEEILISPDEKISFCKSCARSSGYKKKKYKIIDPDMQQWLTENNIAYVKMPKHNPDCETITKGSGPNINSPVNGTEYFINKKNPEPLQLVCKAANDVSRVYWYINNKLYKSCNVGEKQFFVPDEGPVKISCSDDKGRNRDIKIFVRYINL